MTIFEEYKEIVRRASKGKIPLKGTPQIDFYSKYINKLYVTLILDKNRTPRINKMIRWLENCGLDYCGYFTRDGDKDHYVYNINVRLPIDKHKINDIIDKIY